MSKPTLIVLVLLLLWPGIVLAQGHGVEVRAMSAPLQETKPGQILSLSFVVTSRTDGQQEFVESLQLPPAWEAVIPSTTFVLGPSESTTRLVAFRVPASAPANTYEVTYSVRGQQDYAIQGAATVTVVVLRVDKLALLLEDKPDTVIAGDTYQMSLRVINQGNDTAETRLTVTSTKGYPVTLEPAVMTLASGASELVTVTVKTDPNRALRRLDQHLVLVNAQADGATVEVAAVVDLIPRITGEPDLYHRIPATFTLYAINQEDADGLQGEFAGRGTLDEAGTQTIDFTLRGPSLDSTFGTSWFRDEYWLNYATADWDVRAGDQVYGLSELTSYFEYGRGLEVSHHPPGERFGLGTWYLHSRWNAPDEDTNDAERLAVDPTVHAVVDRRGEKPAASTNTLALFVLAYNLGNFLGRLALPGSVQHWSLRSIQVKLIKIGAKVVHHARQVIFQIAEVAVPKELYAEILQLIWALAPARG